MITDRNPIEYRYLSRRLLTAVRESEEAVRPRRKARLRFGPNFATAEVESAAVDPDNLHALARRSVGLVRDYTGNLDRPGVYFRAQLALSYGIFQPHMGWSGGAVAMFCGRASTDEGEPLHVVLVGSGSNAAGYRESTGAVGYCPSDIFGLYTLLDAVREDEDREIDLRYRIDDLDTTNLHRARLAVDHAQRACRHKLGTMDFLAHTLIDADEVPFAGGLERVLVGAPLWVSTPTPAPLVPPHQ